MTKINPVLLAGGSGTRLWPLSRKSYPKQFSNLIGDATLFQQSALRLMSSNDIEFAPHLTLTNSDFRFIVCEQLQEVGIEPGDILIEPEAKNTAPAILAASILMHSKDKEAVLLVSPADHVILDIPEFHKAISAGLSKVKSGNMVTFGIKPSRPETGYGYLEVSSDTFDSNETFDVTSFVEKPDRTHAEKMFASENFLWNSGIFLFKARDMIEAFKCHAPKILKLVTNALETASTDLGFLRLDPKPWTQIEDVSIDYAIMEKMQSLVAVPLQLKWSDLGGWDAVWSESIKDSSENAVSTGAHAIDCSGSLLRSENASQEIVGLGLENILAIAMPDAVLVAHKNRAQEVKTAVELLKVRQIPQATIFPKDFRPWGWFESLVLGNRFQVKRICVNPGAALSLQSHNHRSEHWIVVDGTAQVTIDKVSKLVSEGSSVYVPIGSIHRMSNPGKVPMILIEVQIGSYLKEDDIVRYEDDYDRI